MSRRITRTPARRIGAGIAAFAIGGVFLPTGSQAVGAADGDVDVVNTETVKVYLNADGKVDTKRVYEQLTLTGDGAVEFDNPIETRGLRNLDGFEGFDVEDGEQQVDMSVDGVERLRTVSDYTGDLPLDVNIGYKLDGENVDAEDLVGEEGALEVTYTVKNVTAKSQEISYPDGQGGTVTETVEVPVPMVGSLSTVLPSSFSEVKSEQANMAGDGKGGTKMSFTMTLVPPIGSDTATFGYTAQIEDGLVPPASISALPVNPLESPTFKTAATSYKGGAETGETLTAGATEIDANLLKIRDGAGALLAGLIQLRDGAGELSDGLVNKAAPGAQKLAAGTGDLSDGLGKLKAGAGQLDDGAGKLNDGAGRLADGLNTAGNKAPQLIDGLGKVRAGLVKVDNGLATLYTGVGAVRNDERYQALNAGLEQMLNGVGTKTDVGTLTWAVESLRTKFSAAVPKVQAMADGVYLQSATSPGLYQKLGCAVQVLNLLNNGGSTAGNPCFADIAALTPAVPPLSNDDGTPVQGLRKGIVSGLSGKLQAGLPLLATPDGATNETTLYGGLKTLLNDLTRTDPTNPGAIGALTSMECALDSTSLGPVCEAVRPGKLGLHQGLQQVVAGVPLLVNTIIGTVQEGVGVAGDTAKDGTLRGGMSDLIAGVDALNAGGGTLIDGLSQLAAGAEQLRGGAGQLADGTGKLSTGAGDAAEGSGLIANGAQELSTGLNDAADGSGLLAEGLTKATTSAPALPKGADRLSKEGMSKLIAAGKSTAKEYGKLYAIVGAGSERAKTESMAYGAPAEGRGLTAYSFEIRGEDGEGGRNFKRALGALLLGGLGMGAFALRRRLI